MDRNGFIYFNTRLSPKNSGKADSYAWAIMILDEVLPYQDVTDLKENGNQPAEFNVNLITAFKVDVKVAQSYVTKNGGNDGGKDSNDIPVVELTERQRVILEFISADPTLSAKALSEKMSEKSSVNERTIERDIAKLKKLDYLRRIGGKKDGHWEVNIPLNSVVEIV